MAQDLVKELINAGVHFGHGVSRWNPKMKPYIFAKRGKIHIIDVKKTLAGMLIAKKLLAEIVSTGKDVVFVGTKRQAQKAVETAAEKCGMHYVSHRWLGGMLTNFRTIRSRLQRLEQLEAMEADGTLEKESKKQASRLKREMRKISSNLSGIRKMSRLPGIVVVVDTGKENNALLEAKKLGIATIGLLDTDANPDMVDVAIPANDDSIRAINLILRELADAVSVGKTMVAITTGPGPEAKQRPKRVRSRRTLARADEKQPAEDVSGVEPVETTSEQQASVSEKAINPEQSTVVEEPVKTADAEPVEAAEPTVAIEETSKPEENASLEEQSEQAKTD